MADLQGAFIHITGIVQGVGFRPFVYGLARRLALAGWVRNTSAGVDIAVDGEGEQLQAFLQALRQDAPPLARIDRLDVTWQPANGFDEFTILESHGDPDEFMPVSPDVGICPDCLRELFDPADRRYRYPFINCTHCGPRFTIIRDIPYDRPNTTMADFPMCPACAAEYREPLDRRFHAQPVACPVCGPGVWLEYPAAGQVSARGDEAILAARAMLRQGKILAVKGLGGFHLACDATNEAAVSELRRRKLRVDKPFALMMADLESAAQHCLISPAERELLGMRQRPIVILRRHPNSTVSQQAAPGQNTLGVMLPYTPLHYLLFAGPDAQGMVFDMPPLVMTSGNLSEEPICCENQSARQNLAGLADGFLLHNRDIQTRCDDSVLHMFPLLREEKSRKLSPLYFLRRSRGYAPDGIRLPYETPPLLAAGAELKNTFCLARQQYAFLSHHIGDMENYETLQAFEDGVAHFEKLFRIHPQALACDLHPDYLATRYAQQRAAQESLPLLQVQHHHAHIAACMADNGLRGDEPVIGLAFDGTGYGDDGAVWGGEVLVADYHGYRRAAHLAYARLPGGDLAVRQPWRMALSWLAQAGLVWEEDLAPVRHARELQGAGAAALPALDGQLRSGLNAPWTSSMGRLFDAVAALLDVRQAVNYEAQGAIELEALADGRETGFYKMDVAGGLLDPAPMLARILQDLRAGVEKSRISARFHNSVAYAALQVCRELREKEGLHQVALSGGVWQNSLLLVSTTGLLLNDGFRVLVHRQAPANDGGLALGQALVLAASLR